MDREVTSTRYRYLLRHEVDGSDQSNLIDSLEDEVFPIREILGEAVMNAAIKEGVLNFDHESDTRLGWFADCFEVLSVHLSEYIIGLEIAEGRNAEGSRVQVELRKFAGCRGNVITVPMKHRIEFPSGEITPTEEDVDYLRDNWSTLPRWAQDAYRLKFPELRRL